LSIADLVLSRLEGRRVLVPHVDGALRAYLAACLVRAKKQVVLIAKNLGDAEELHRDLAFLLGVRAEDSAPAGLLLVADEERSPYEEHSPDQRMVIDRLGALYRLSREPERTRAVITTPHALARKQVPPELFAAGDYLVARERVDRDRLLGKLVASGYNSVSIVEDPGTFCVRGGIIDVYSPYLPRPIRIDLFGDEIESLRTFDPATQRNLDELEDAVLLPAREIVLSDEVIGRSTGALDQLGDELGVPSKKLRSIKEDVQNRIHFFGIESLLPLFHDHLASLDAYLPRGENVAYLSESDEAIEAASAEIHANAELGYAEATHHHRLALRPETHLADALAVLDRGRSASLRVDLPALVSGKAPAPIVTLEAEDTRNLRAEILKATKAHDEDGSDMLAPVTDRLRRFRNDGYVTLLVAHTRGQAERLKSLLVPKGVEVRLYNKPLKLSDLPGGSAAEEQRSPFRERSVHAWIVLGEITHGFVLPAGRIAILSEEEIFGQRTKSKKRRAKSSAAFVSDLADLKVGDFVVHIDHGVGKYHGIVRLAVNGVDGDFLHLEYKDGDKLYLPVHRLALIQKFASAEDGRNPPLSKLGSQTWISTKKKVKDTLLKMAAELLRLYAARATQKGFRYPPPNEDYTRFEAEFAFEPTPDQQKAIDDVLSDLTRDFPMDRLICGDVGYGKTEVAMRGAMMATLAKKQVAVLVPTTVLAAQHYHVMSERFANFPVRIGVVSRFSSSEEQKKTLSDLAAGNLDIIVGTHRLLSKDVRYQDLGMVIIDEEHRFGVKHKEQLKKLRAQVHVLTMSATPIPRTMHMGMMGVRDLSIIATPPEDRLAVKTEVHKFSEEVIREAVLQEIRRGGQCFVVHNRVDTIESFKHMLEKLVPESRIIVGHGQMDEDLLEKVMVDFMAKQYNVLLSTTIIESGIDIPNANTIIVNRADRLGLAQLYQLRGRVGRGRQRGFAHLLIPPGNMSPDAKKRIAVIQRFTELGAGFKIASHDLEIRGAGNILGKEQSGTISAVGFEMYQALLAEAIEELKGVSHRTLKEPEVNVPVSALIPDNYVPPPSERLSYYQRLNRANDDESTYNILQEIADLYGTPPAEVENMASLMLVKQRLSRLGALTLDFGAETKSMPARVVLRFDPEEVKLSPADLVKYVEKGRGRRKLVPDGRVMINLTRFDDPREILQQAKDILDELILFGLNAKGAS